MRPVLYAITRSAPSAARGAACVITATGKAGAPAGAIEKALTMPPHMPTQWTLPARPTRNTGNRLRASTGRRSDGARVARTGCARAQVAVEHHAHIADQDAPLGRHAQPARFQRDQAVARQAFQF